MKKKISVEMLTVSALFLALEIVLNRFVSINTVGLKIGFAFVPIVVCAIIYGPTMAAIVNALADFLGAILFPIGPYFPGFTLTAALMGLVWGHFLYRGELGERKLRFFPNILLPSIVNNLIFGLCVNTYWITIISGSKTYLGWFTYRITEYLILIPLNVIMIPILIKLSEKIKKYTR